MSDRQTQNARAAYCPKCKELGYPWWPMGRLVFPEDKDPRCVHHPDVPLVFSERRG